MSGRVGNPRGIITAPALPWTIDYGCPDWCRRTDHDADVVDEKDPPIHYGPDFGDVAVQAAGGGHFEALVYVGRATGYEQDTAKLRLLAADLVKAAEWMEAQR